MTTTPRRNRLAALLLGAILCWGSAAAARAEGAASTEPRTFELESLNRRYSMPDSEFAPVRQGPITVHLSSPTNLLTLLANSVRFEPLGDGTYRTRVTIDFLGRGDVVAVFETPAGSSSRTEDKLIAPRQTVHLDGRVRFHRTPTGWEVTLPEAS